MENLNAFESQHKKFKYLIKIEDLVKILKIKCLISIPFKKKKNFKQF
jgi:hypothetical protein